MKIAIIGAGAAGLVSAKFALEQGFRCEVFEQTGNLGGTWIYTDRTNVDEDGLPIHTSMYKNLMTNLPKEAMAFTDFPYPEQTRSYLTQQEVLDYFNRFADRFTLRKHIQFYKRVIKVKPLPCNKWSLIVQDEKTKVEETELYDAVFVCSGHYREPYLPKISGQDLFRGRQLHSRNYRTTEMFEHKRVLVRGAGPSGRDISVLISKVAQQIFLSYQGDRLNKNFGENVTEKPAVVEFDENGAVFEDGTRETFDIILYCTGYNYSFPFLTDECGVKVDDNWVRPLYKQIISIEHPTMYFIGLPYLCCVIPMFDLQVRFALAALGEKFPLPSKDNMMKELDDWMTKRKNQGIVQWKAHEIGGGDEQDEYFDDLAKTAEIRGLPVVLGKLFARILKGRDNRDCFKIVDDENFVQVV